MSKKSLLQEKNTKKLPGNYIYTSMVSHRGTVVSLGMNEEGKIKYAALDLSPGDGKSAIDRECWSDIRELAFPQELSQSGYGVVQNYRMPLRDEKNNILKDEDVKSKIDPFYSSKPKGEGTGLGLSISHGLIQDNKGYLRINSERGVSTTLIVDLPISKN